MPINRKVEVHKLTISGLPVGTSYGELLANLRAGVVSPDLIAFKLGERERLLYSAEYLNSRLRMRFASYKPGFKPDVIDINALEVAPNPIGPDQTPIDWTHVLGGSKGSRYVLLIESHQGSIRPRQIHEYLQSMIDNTYIPAPNSGPARTPATVNLEAEPSSEFAQEIDRLDRITQATVRVVESNPGWLDHQSELALLSEESNAGKAEVTLFSKFGKSLDFAKGIIGVIKEKLADHTLDGAKVSGVNDGQEVNLNTRVSVRVRRLVFESDASGQVDERDAWLKLSAMMDDMD
ncbi:hypothetical protein TA3x_001128 [Tundrisphaera sp. TA3]|uniref:hypothetical protein n=1 Tax=Tundrisphaera sp. TA3 TaxID=3435775 RepID=UPI003EBF4423